ncbi:hypothetical protein GQ43DRAFT_438242 [Delitschia confertaspora ATCC 74209]|uniref:Phytanoyl-CoA dioxygenase n=1 Tax=Delitschia confertaspora ATCC 74209 TaxID=1513339 RepID=A0A9P4JTG2_9PLEO|nr:hypothetical protein GQ43DRAFT_438242 [Delitschia confertaspora ATCC 74209]
MPHHTLYPLSTFSPKAWSSIRQLLDPPSSQSPSQPSRVNLAASTWKDGFIVNLGTPQGHNKPTRPQDLKGWHVDGDFFVHYLDSPEQALLVIPLWTSIAPSAGGTLICPSAIPIIASHLYAHPEGVSPRMTPRAQNPTFSQENSDGEDGLKFFNDIARSMPSSAFIEATGAVGDVYFLHPLMLHSASNNALRIPRVITNPPVSLNEPFNFDRPDEKDYSVVELKTLRALGKSRLEGWRITEERQGVIPERVRIQERMKREEEERLRKLKEQQGVVEEMTSGEQAVAV